MWEHWVHVPDPKDLGGSARSSPIVRGHLSWWSHANLLSWLWFSCSWFSLAPSTAAEISSYARLGSGGNESLHLKNWTNGAPHCYSPLGTHESQLSGFLPRVLSDFDNSILILMGCGLTVAQLASPQWQGWELISVCYLLFMYLHSWSVYEYLVQFCWVVFLLSGGGRGDIHSRSVCISSMVHLVDASSLSQPVFQLC